MNLKKYSGTSATMTQHPAGKAMLYATGLVRVRKVEAAFCRIASFD